MQRCRADAHRLASEAAGIGTWCCEVDELGRVPHGMQVRDVQTRTLDVRAVAALDRTDLAVVAAGDTIR